MTLSNKSRVIGDAIVSKLETDLAPTEVGDGVAPDPTPDLYAVVDFMDGMIEGDLDDVGNWVKVVVQVRSVGLDRSGAQLVQDKVRASILDKTLSVSGATLVVTDHEIGGRVSRDDDADPTSRFTGFDRVALYFDTRG